MEKIKQPQDKPKKKLTKSQQRELFTNAITIKLQEAYFKGISHGSHLQCSTILDIYKAKVDKTPKAKQTKAFLQKVINDIFDFCEKGKATDIETVMKSIQAKNNPNVKSEDNLNDNSDETE